MNLNNIISPTLILDKDKCIKNIQTMTEKAKQHNLLFRPHFKTHQSRTIGNWFKQAGVDKITVSSLQMANYFADDWNDITIAFPTNIRQIGLINSLAKKVTLNLTIENIESIDFLINNLESPVNFF